MARGHLEPLRYSRAQLVRDVEDEEEEEDVNARAKVASQMAPCQICSALKSGV